MKEATFVDMNCALWSAAAKLVRAWLYLLTVSNADSLATWMGKQPGPVADANSVT